MKKLNVLIIIIVLLLSGCGTGNVISDKTDSSVSEKSLSDISRIIAGSSVGMERFFCQVTYIRIMRCLNCSARSIRYRNL